MFAAYSFAKGWSAYIDKTGNYAKREGLRGSLITVAKTLIFMI